MRTVPSPAQQIKAESLANGERAEPAEIWKARKFIHEHSGEKFGLRKVAKSVNISANHLSERFKEVTGINFVDYVGRQRIERAQDLLQHRHRRISEIAFEVGFQSLSQFNRSFKNFTGQSPTEFRAATKNSKNA